MAPAPCGFTVQIWQPPLLDPLVPRGPFRKGGSPGLCPEGLAQGLGPDFADTLPAAGGKRRRRQAGSQGPGTEIPRGRFSRSVQPLCLPERSGIQTSTRLPGLRVRRALGPLTRRPRHSPGLPTPNLPSRGRGLLPDAQGRRGAAHLVGLLAGPAPAHLRERRPGAEAALEVGFLRRRREKAR